MTDRDVKSRTGTFLFTVLAVIKSPPLEFRCGTTKGHPLRRCQKVFARLFSEMSEKGPSPDLTAVLRVLHYVSQGPRAMPRATLPH